MTRLEVAVRHEQWELVWLYLLVGVSEAASKLPPEALSALLDLLADEPDEDPR
jgi:hypothetical protein